LCFSFLFDDSLLILLRVVPSCFLSRRLEVSLDIRIGLASVDATMHNSIVTRNMFLCVFFRDIFIAVLTTAVIEVFVVVSFLLF